MHIEVTVPDPGEDGPKEASISFWMFEVGDQVSEGEDLVEGTRSPPDTSWR